MDVPRLDVVSASRASTFSDGYSVLVENMPQSAYFQVALEHLLPVVGGEVVVSDPSKSDYWVTRCFCAYVLYRLYAPHPIALNPFQSAFLDAFSSTSSESPSTSFSISLNSDKRAFHEVLTLILNNRGHELGTLSAREALKLHSEDTNARPAPLPPTDMESTNKTTPSNLALGSLSLGDAEHQNTTNEPRINKFSGQQLEPLLTSAPTRVLTLSEQSKILRMIPEVSRAELTQALPPEMISTIVKHNTRIALPILTRLLSDQTPSVSVPSSPDLKTTMSENVPEQSIDIEPYIDALSSLPPVLSSFDLIGGLLRLEKDKTSRLPSSDSENYSTTAEMTKQDLVVKSLILERFINHSLLTIDEYERQDEVSGSEPDDQGLTARTIQLLSKFVLSVMRTMDSTKNRTPPALSAPSSTSKPSHFTSSNIALAPPHHQHQPHVQAPSHPSATGEVLSNSNQYHDHNPRAFSEGLDIELTNFSLIHARLADANALYSALTSRYSYGNF